MSTAGANVSPVTEEKKRELVELWIRNRYTDYSYYDLGVWLETELGYDPGGEAIEDIEDLLGEVKIIIKWGR